MKTSALVQTVVALIIILTTIGSEAKALDCSTQERLKDLYCQKDPRGRLVIQCRGATKALEACLAKGGTVSPKPTPVPTAGPAGTFSGVLSSTKIKNSKSNCEVRTSIPATLVVTLKGKKVTGKLSDGSRTLKGSLNNKGYKVSQTKTSGSKKTEYKIVATNITTASATFKYTKTRKNANKSECSASYTGVFSRL